MSVIRSWTPEQLKKQIMDDLVANGEIAGKVVETDARKRLLAIKDPEWGAAYRQKVVARLLRSEVERKQNEVVILVGVAQSKEAKHHGFYIELGSSTAPAHPFLRPAVFNNGRKIVDLLSGK